jgi:hypothetical protein
MTDWWRDLGDEGFHDQAHKRAHRSVTQMLNEMWEAHDKILWDDLEMRFKRGDQEFSRSDVALLVHAMQRMISVVNLKGSV